MVQEQRFKFSIVEARERGSMTVDNAIVMIDEFISIFFEVASAEAGTARHCNELRKATIVVSFSFVARDFFHAVSGDIRRRVEVDIAEGMVTHWPQLRQSSGGIEVIFRPSFDKSFVSKVRIEQEQMVVGTKRFFTIFTTAEETNTSAEALAEPFHKVLIVL